MAPRIYTRLEQVALLHRPLIDSLRTPITIDALGLNVPTVVLGSRRRAAEEIRAFLDEPAPIPLGFYATHPARIGAIMEAIGNTRRLASGPEDSRFENRFNIELNGSLDIRTTSPRIVTQRALEVGRSNGIYATELPRGSMIRLFTQQGELTVTVLDADIMQLENAEPKLRFKFLGSQVNPQQRDVVFMDLLCIPLYPVVSNEHVRAVLPKVDGMQVSFGPSQLVLSL